MNRPLFFVMDVQQGVSPVMVWSTMDLLSEFFKRQEHGDETMEMRKDTFLFGGYSQFPTGTAGFEMFKHFGVGFEVDPDTWEILDVSSTFITELSSRILLSIFVGKSMRDGGIAAGIREFDARYFSKGKKTIIAAIIEAEKSYLNYINQ